MPPWSGFGVRHTARNRLLCVSDPRLMTVWYCGFLRYRDEPSPLSRASGITQTGIPPIRPFRPPGWGSAVEG